MFQQCILNQVVKIPFLSVGLTTGKTTFTPMYILANGAVSSVVPTYLEIGNGLYVAILVPNVTGKWSIFIEQQLYTFEVVERELSSILKDMTDESLGSWEWNKVTGVLTLLRQEGGTLATFNVSDNSNAAFRERIS